MTQAEQRKELLQEIERDVLPVLERVQAELSDMTRGRKTARRLHRLRQEIVKLCQRGSGKLYAPR